MPAELINHSNNRYEFKNNHGEWINTVKPDLGPGISERVWEALMTTDENLDICHSVKSEARAALIDLLGVLFIFLFLVMFHKPKIWLYGNLIFLKKNYFYFYFLNKRKTFPLSK